MKSIRIMCNGYRGDGQPESCSMTSIQVCFEDNETDFHNAKAKALGVIVQELCRYGLHEALNGIGILDEHGKRMKAEVEAWAARQVPVSGGDRDAS